MASIKGRFLDLISLSELFSRWMQKAPKNPEPARRWQSFLDNHVKSSQQWTSSPSRQSRSACFYCFFVIAHDRRQILHCNVTRHPTGRWITQQLREAFPYNQNHRYLIHDRDTKFGDAVSAAVSAIGLQAVRTSFRSPWQNGAAERWVGSCRQDLLDHLIPLGERHLKRLLSEYVRYYHADRTHMGLAKDTPGGRERAKVNTTTGPLIS
jgi:putative transposase